MSIESAMQQTEEATKRLMDEYRKQVSQFSSDITQHITQHMDDSGAFKPIVRRSRFVDSLVKTKSPMLLNNIYDLLVQAGSFAMGELDALPGAGDIARPSLVALETVAEENYKTIFNDMKSVTTELVDGLKVEIEHLTTHPSSFDLSAKTIAAKTNHSVSQAKTLVNTGLAAVQRDVHLETLKGMPDKKRMAMYMGPGPDGVIRPFCKVLVNRVIKEEYFDDLKNNQKGASSFKSNGGGWNCRHRLMPVTAAFVKRNNLKPINMTTVAKANSAAKAKR